MLTSITIPITDAAQQIRTASRIIESNIEEATKMVQSAANPFDNAAHRWASQSRQSEQTLRSNTAAGKLNEAKGKHNAVRTRIGPVQSLFRRALQSLNDMKMKMQQQRRVDDVDGE